MYRLEDKELEQLRKQFCDDCRVDNSRYRRWADKQARVEFPLGELIANLAGFAWAWQLQGDKILTGPITEKDRFDAQGLEGKAIKHTDLGTAIVIWAQCPKFRCAVYSDPHPELLSRPDES